jgi:hypothetical protein
MATFPLIHPLQALSSFVEDGLQHRLTLAPGGNIGIGEPASINARLHVKDNISADGDTYDNPIAILQNERVNTGSGAATLRFDTNEISSTNQYQRGAISAEYDGANNLSGRLLFGTADSSGTMRTRMRLDGNNELKLGNDTTYSYLRVEGANANVAANIQLAHLGGGGRTGVDAVWNISRGSNETSFGGGVTNGSTTLGGLAFWNQNGGTTLDAMRLKDDGNAIFGYKVGIKQPNPSYDFEIGTTNTQNMKVGWAIQEFFTLSIHSSDTRWYKLANYGTGIMLQGQLFMSSARNGGAQQTNGSRIQHGSLAGYNNGVNTNDWGDLGTNYGHTNYYVFVGSDDHVYIRVGGSIYGGEVYCHFTGRANWTYDGSYVTSEP